MDAPAQAEHITFETAASHATSAVPRARSEDRAGEVLRSLIGRKFESSSHIVICDGDRFLGILRIEDLLQAPADRPIEDLMDRKAPVVAPGLDQEIAAWRAVRHRESALAVVDAEGRFIGLIPPHRLLAVLLSEHEEDLSRLGGFLKGASSARAASEEPVERRFWHRVPWLLLGLAGALVAADFVSQFQTQLEEKLILAFFIPGIVYLADAVGTQTETVVVRGLSVGVSMRRMLKREILAGLAIGIALGAISIPAVWLRWGDLQVALVVGTSLFAACSTSTVIAMALPWLLDVFDLDPAFATGPVATVIQDLLSILIYFRVALAVS